MIRVIRRGVFETNSSSTHSISIVSKEDYDKWNKGELLLNDDEFVTVEDAIKEIKRDDPEFNPNNEDEVSKAFRDYDYQTSEEYQEDEYLETYTRNFTTKNGDKIVAFGKYGTDN